MSEHTMTDDRITHGCNMNMNMPIRSVAHRTSHPSKARKRRAGLRARGALLAPYAWEKKSERERDILPSPLAPEQSKEREREIYIYICIYTYAHIFFMCISLAASPSRYGFPIYTNEPRRQAVQVRVWLTLSLEDIPVPGKSQQLCLETQDCEPSTCLSDPNASETRRLAKLR